MANQRKDVLTENSYINEQNEWPERIYEIDEQDYVHGGENGYSNVPHEQLTNRTRFLKESLSELNTRVQEFKADVSEQNTVNRLRFETLNSDISVLRENLNDLRAYTDDIKENLEGEIDLIETDIDNIRNDLLTHVHDYAGSDMPGGPATELHTEPTTDIVNLIGVSDGDTNVKTVNNVFAANGVVQARQFTGDLTGNATSASKLKDSINVTVTGDVTSSPVITNFNQDLNIRTVISNTGVEDGHYGPTSRHEINPENPTVVIPAITVDKSGRITEAENYEITINNNARSNTAGSSPMGGKLFIVGAQLQNTIADTYSNKNSYIIDGRLYSNDLPVIDTESAQSLNNKLYEGYKLGPACEQEIDNTPGGTLGSNSLITSDAVARHEHRYAASTIPGGAAKEVEITANNNTAYLLVNSGDDGRVEINHTITIGDNMLRVNNMYVDEQLTIPGGQIWIDTSIDSTGTATGILADNTVKYDDTAIRQDMSEMTASFENMTQEFSELKETMNEYDRQAAINKNGIDDNLNFIRLNQDAIRELNDNLESTNSKLDEIDSILNSFREQIDVLKDEITRLKER